MKSAQLSIGNDLVCMASLSIRARTLEKRYLQKLFTPYEQAQIATSQHPLSSLAMLWAAKESVYKYTYRLHPLRIFRPKNLEITLAPPYAYISGLPVEIHFTNLEEGTLHAVAYTQGVEKKRILTGKGSDKEKIREDLVQKLGMKIHLLRDTENLPLLFFPSLDLYAPLSFSDEGHTIAYAALLPLAYFHSSNISN